MICVVLDGRREEGIDEGCLSQTRLASNLLAISPCVKLGCGRSAYHYGEGGSTLRNDLVSGDGRYVSSGKAFCPGARLTSGLVTNHEVSQ